MVSIRPLLTRALVALTLASAVVVAGSCGDATGPETFPDLTIMSDSLRSAVRGEPYAETLHASGGDGTYTWELAEGVLPEGVSLARTGATATLTGVPGAQGTFAFSLRVRSGDGQTATRQFSLRVRPPPQPVHVATPALPPVVVGGAYDVTLRASGGDGQTYAWAVVEGSLPAGFQLTEAGRIHGIPTTVDTARFTVEATSGGRAHQREYALAVIPERADAFNITIFPVTPLAAELVPHIERAVEQWEAALPRNLQAVTIPTGFFGANECAGYGSLINGTMTDDLLIILSVEHIDGPGGVLGRAGPCGLRADTLPFAGILILDTEDVAPRLGSESLTYIISHEIAHILGFGTLWTAKGLIAGAGTSDPRYTGAAAMAEYNAVGGSDAVPLEAGGGLGTRESHWRKTTFGPERMTGFAEPPGIHQPLSRVSIASLADLGFDVDLAAADDYQLGQIMAPGPAEAHWGGLGYDHVITGPVRILRPDGSSVVLDLARPDRAHGHDHR
jgi:hypothetical protein